MCTVCAPRSELAHLLGTRTPQSQTDIPFALLSSQHPLKPQTYILASFTQTHSASARLYSAAVWICVTLGSAKSSGGMRWRFHLFSRTRLMIRGTTNCAQHRGPGIIVVCNRRCSMSRWLCPHLFCGTTTDKAGWGRHKAPPVVTCAGGAADGCCCGNRKWGGRIIRFHCTAHAITDEKQVGLKPKIVSTVRKI